LSHVPTGSKLAEQRIEPMIASAGGPMNARPLRHLPCRDRGSRHIVNVERAKRFPPHRPHTLGSAPCYVGSAARRVPMTRDAAYCERSFRTMIRTHCILSTSRRRAAVLD
jgi:hypothetical protein